MDPVLACARHSVRDAECVIRVVDTDHSKLPSPFDDHTSPKLHTKVIKISSSVQRLRPPDTAPSVTD